MSAGELSLEQQAILELSVIVLRLEAILKENTQALHLVVDEMRNRAERST